MNFNWDFVHFTVVCPPFWYHNNEEHENVNVSWDFDFNFFSNFCPQILFNRWSCRDRKVGRKRTVEGIGQAGEFISIKTDENPPKCTNSCLRLQWWNSCLESQHSHDCSFLLSEVHQGEIEFILKQPIAMGIWVNEGVTFTPSTKDRWMVG